MDNSEQTIDLALEVLNTLHTKGLNEKSLTLAKNYVKGQFPSRYETIGQLSDLLTKIFWYDFDEYIINDFEKNVYGLTLAKSKKIISPYFPNKNFQFVLIGKSTEIKKIAYKYGPVKRVNIND